MKNQTKTYEGFVVPTPAHLNPDKKPDLYVFSGVEISRGDTFATVFRALNVPGFVPTEQFAKDVHASGSPPKLRGRLTLLPPDYKFGEFTYRRPGGGAATARTGDSIEVPPPNLHPRAQDIGKAKTAPPPPDQGGMDMSF